MTTINIDPSNPMPCDKALMVAVTRSFIEREAAAVEARQRATTGREPEHKPQPIFAGGRWRVGLGGVLFPLSYDNATSAEIAAMFIDEVSEHYGGSENCAPHDIAPLQWVCPELIAEYIASIEKYLATVQAVFPGILIPDQVKRTPFPVLMNLWRRSSGAGNARDHMNDIGGQLRARGATDEGLRWLLEVAVHNMLHFESVRATVLPAIRVLVFRPEKAD